MSNDLTKLPSPVAHRGFFKKPKTPAAAGVFKSLIINRIKRNSSLQYFRQSAKRRGQNSPRFRNLASQISRTERNRWSRILDSQKQRTTQHYLTTHSQSDSGKTLFIKTDDRGFSGIQQGRINSTKAPGFCHDWKCGSRPGENISGYNTVFNIHTITIIAF